jgi:hypothetical protein
MSKKISYNLELLNDCIERDLPIDVEIPEKINGQIKIIFTCNCGIKCLIVFSYIYKYGMKCRKCKIIIANQKTKQTFLKKYGTENPYNLESFKKVRRETCLIKYGVPNYSKTESYKIKRDKTNLEKYGSIIPMQNENVKQKFKRTNMEKYGKEYATQSIEVQEKTKKTNLEKYGTEYYLQSKDAKEKKVNTNIKKYGVKNVLQNKDINQKRINTNIERYGDPNPLKSQIVQEKYKNYWRENFNVEHNMQVPEIVEKQQKSALTYKSYTFPSGKQVLIQGYENLALDKLSTTYDEDKIIVGASLVPKIIYKQNNKTKRYFPDIYINFENLIIEVKSIYTMEKELEKNLAKRKACIEQGYNFQFWIFDRKQNLQILNKDEEYIPRSK